MLRLATIATLVICACSASALSEDLLSERQAWSNLYNNKTDLQADHWFETAAKGASVSWSGRVTRVEKKYGGIAVVFRGDLLENVIWCYISNSEKSLALQLSKGSQVTCRGTLAEYVSGIFGYFEIKSGSIAPPQSSKALSDPKSSKLCDFYKGTLASLRRQKTTNNPGEFAVSEHFVNCPDEEITIAFSVNEPTVPIDQTYADRVQGHFRSRICKYLRAPLVKPNNWIVTTRLRFRDNRSIDILYTC